MTTELFIPVTTTPFAAILAASGGARWLAGLGQDLTGDLVEVHMAYLGDRIRLRASANIDPVMVRAQHYQSPQAKWILTAKNGLPPEGIGVIDYEAERQRNNAYFEHLKQLQKSGIDWRKLPKDEQTAIEQGAPQTYWPVVAMINQMGALSAYNKAVERWHACRTVYPELVALIWEMWSGKPGALEAAEEAWTALAKQHPIEKKGALPATQAVNPEQGKGANKAKADKLAIGGQESFWLLEYFKFAGLYQAALPRTVQGRKDRKTYVVIPSYDGIEQRWHEQVFTKFQKQFWASTAIKMDILAALRYTTVILEEWEGAERSSGRRRKPSDYVQGLAVASFKDLGSAVAMMNLATIGLPDWIDWPNNADDARRLAAVLQEQQLLISNLDEKKSEEERLLRHYRDFLSDRDPLLRSFFAFTTAYAGHTLRAMSKRARIRRFSTDTLEVIILSQDAQRPKKLQTVFETPGFRTIATAIRQSTVLQQYHKAQHDDNTYDVRYGLADDLFRHSRNNQDFMRALMQFLTDYSKENARIMERNKGKKYRKRISVTTGDIAELSVLVDDYGAPTIASMLIAFGYARDPYTPDSGEETGTPEAEQIVDVTADDNAEGPF